MNKEYSHLYIFDKFETSITNLPFVDFEEAVKDLDILKEDETVCVWDSEGYQVWGIKISMHP